MSHHKISIWKLSLIHVLSLFFLSLSVILGLPCSSIVPHRATIKEVTSCCRARYSEELKIKLKKKNNFRGSVSGKVIKIFHSKSSNFKQSFLNLSCWELLNKLKWDILAIFRWVLKTYISFSSTWEFAKLFIAEISSWVWLVSTKFFLSFYGFLIWFLTLDVGTRWIIADFGIF